MLNLIANCERYGKYDDWCGAYYLESSGETARRGIVCNLYSITTSQAAIIAFTRAMRDQVGNLPPLPGIFSRTTKRRSCAMLLMVCANFVAIGAGNAVYEDLKHPRFIGDSRSGYFFLLVGYGPDFVSSGFQKKRTRPCEPGFFLGHS
jgi:hypothetical protein